jgi:VWFA-related protein
MVRRQAAASMALALLAWTIHAQPQKFVSGTVGVRVDVLVTDGRAPVAGLTANDFELRDNGVAQRVEVISAGDVPINAVLALDTSASLLGKRQRDLVSAADSLLDGLTPADRASLTTFSHVVRPRIGLTADMASVRDALHHLAPKGETSLMDGVYTALVSTLDEPGRFLVVVCTDGGDTTSWLQPGEVVAVARRTNAVLYAVTSADAKRSDALKQLADTTGGRLLPVASSGELRDAFQRILAEFRSRYVLAYSPDGVAPGGFHRIEVSVPRRHVTIKARPGYAGPDAGVRP